jgi:hypothetical protein
MLEELIKKTELTIYHYLGWHLNEPTVFDFLGYLLHLSNDNFDFSEIMLQVSEVTNICFMGKLGFNLQTFFAYKDLVRVR